MIPIEEECWTCVSERGMRFEMNGQLLSSDEKTVASPMEGNYIATGVDANGLSQVTTWENTGPNLYGSREIHGNPSPHYYSFTDQGKFHGFCGFLLVEDPQASNSTPRTGSLASLASCKRLATLLALPASQAFNWTVLSLRHKEYSPHRGSVQKPTKTSVPWTSGWLRTGFPQWW